MEEIVQQEEIGEDIGLVGRMFRIFYAPGETFAAVRRQQSWLDWFVPTILVVLATLASTSYTMPIIMEVQQEAMQEQLKNMPAGAPDMAETMQNFTTIGTIVGIPFSIFILLFFMGLILFLVARFALGGEVTYSQMLAVVAYTSLIGIVHVAVVTPLVLHKKEIIVYTGLGLLVPADMLKTYVGQLIAAVDLFMFWRVCLTAIGIAVIGNMPTRKAAIGIFALWIIMIFIQAGFGLLQQQLGAGFNPGS